MVTILDNRLDPSVFSKEELESLLQALSSKGGLELVDQKGGRTKLPQPVYEALHKALQSVKDGKVIVFVPEDDVCTTQAAADHLGVSRQHLVDLLERGDIPFHRVGTHRRIRFTDLLAFERKRDAARREGLGQLMQEVDEAGLYDASYTGDAG